MNMTNTIVDVRGGGDKMELIIENHRGQKLKTTGNTDIYNVKMREYHLGGSGISMLDSWVAVKMGADLEEVKFEAGVYEVLRNNNMKLEDVDIKIIRVAQINTAEKIVKGWSKCLK